MKVNPNKGAVHMSDDILNENHQLKTEIIKIRKALKSNKFLIQTMKKQWLISLIKLLMNLALINLDSYFNLLRNV
jgi:hypothetical protein